MTNRLELIQRRMAEQPFDWLALVPGSNYYYATGADLHPSERLNLLLIPKKGEPVALAPALEAPYLAGLEIQVYEWRDEEGPLEALHRMLQATGVPTAALGVEYDVMRLRESKMLTQVAPTLRLHPADEFLAALRAVKDEGEIEAIRRAVRITERALERTISAIRVGQSEREVVAMLQTNMLAEGADRMSFGLVLSGPRSAEPHAGSSQRSIQPGDLVLIDCGAALDHFSGDITRCLAVEPVSEEIERLYALCLAANEAGRAAVRPGISGHEVDRITRQVIEAGGYGEFFIHRTGHGMGLEGHEAPYIVAGNHTPLAHNNVFTIEPGIYLPGIAGVRVEDNLVVTQSGSECLTTFPRELIRLSSPTT